MSSSTTLIPSTLGQARSSKSSIVQTASPGHAAYSWEAEGILLTGDAVPGLGAFPRGYCYYFDATAYQRLLERLQGIPC